MTDNLHDLTEILCWNEPEPDKLAHIEERYLSALCHRLGSKLAHLGVRSPQLRQAVEARLSTLSDEAMARLLLEPATSRRVVTDLHSLEDIATHFLDSKRPDAGDAVAHLLGAIPIRLGFADRRGAEGLLERVVRLAQTTVAALPPVGVFLRVCMRELILREEPSQPGFTSNSPQGYVGRSIITNGHLPMVDDVMLAEALVHEATHGFVGMSEAIGLSGIEGATPWLNDNQPYDGVSRVISPWTGTSLDIPTYLHACFVWWGLLHFWARMREHRVCDHTRARSRFFRALKGFEQDAFLGQVEPYRDIIATQLMDVFEDMASTLHDVRMPQATEALL